MLSLGRVPDGAAARREPAQSRYRGRGARGAPANSARTSTRFWPARRSPGWATAVWAGWPPAISTRSPRWSIPAIGYGIRYEFGIFDQEIRDGWQVEKTDNWLVDGNPWEIAKPDVSYLVNWGGYSEHYVDGAGHDRVRWIPGRVLKGVAYDTPIQGYGVHTCNALTLWSARAVKSFALDAFNTGDYYKAVEDEVNSETVTKVLYPNDEPEVGKRLRLLQQYFFVSCSLQHVLHIMDDLADASVRELPERFALQLNDTHPSIGVAELMRLLVDERQHRLGRGVGHHRRDVRLHQPHAAAGGAGDVAAGDVRRVAAPPPRDHLRDQPALPRRGARGVPRRRRPAASHVVDRRGRREERAHGAPGDRRQPRDQRCRRAALRTAQGERPQGLLRDVAGAVLQQDQRCDPAALPGAGEPRPACTARRHHRRRLAHRPRSTPWPGGVRRRPRVPADNGARSSAPTRPGSREYVHADHRHRTEPRLAVRHPGQADPRVQAPAPQRAAHHHAVPPPEAEPGPGDPAARVHVRRQGGARLLHGQADHQADQRRRRDGQQRPRRQPVPEGRVRAELQRAERGDRSTRPPTCRSRSRPPARRRRAPAT